MLILAFRPFGEIQPYAEIGPIFLHARECAPYASHKDKIPAVLKTSSPYLLRGYDKNERIVYGTGTITPNEEIPPHKAKDLFSDSKVKFIHVRSAGNNCFQARIERS